MPAAAQPVRIAINGAGGRMGCALRALLAHDARFQLLHAAVAAGSALIGTPVTPGVDGLRYDADWNHAPRLDVVVDFSRADGLCATLEHCLRTGTALVTGTTDCDASLRARVVAAGAHIGVLHAANFSLGVAMLARLARQAAAALPEWDAEIVEAHHAAKRDAPSGTALMLGRTVAQARGSADDARVGTNRQGLRVPGSVGYAVVRGGDIVGEHTVMLAGLGERLELVHRATDRAVFARGALQAAAWLCGRGAGAWTLDDVLAVPAAVD